MFGQNAGSMNPIGNSGRNTYLRTLTNNDTALGVSLWNNMLSLRIRPAEGRDANGVIQYSKTRIIQSALTPENSSALLQKLCDEIESQGDVIVNPISVSVETTPQNGRCNVIGIELIPTEDPASPDAYLFITMGVSAEGIADAGNTTKHLFAKKAVFTGYNPTTGARNKSMINTDYDYFIDVLKQVDGRDAMRKIVQNHQIEVDKNRGTNSGSGSNGGGFFSQQPPASSPAGGFANFGVPAGGADEVPFT